MNDPVGILYQDEQLLVVDKPPRMLVVDAPGRRDTTVVQHLAARLGQRVYAVHRLDEDTTGALVLARTEAARRGLEAVFREHRAERVYLALLSRAPSPAAGRIQSRLMAKGGLMRSVHDGGENAVTHYRMLERRGRFTLVECRLETGRRNQIRVHMADIGCPVVGDRKYGYRSRQGRGFNRVMLHSWRIALPHPVTGARVEVVADPREPELRV